ncbi:MAG: hypothetical protein A3I78_02145 [Gammaproteobacteria bacterium RIFCSPLOWO2_02_FULL_56_15]|nr:MAG: hypothetical protein A3I78_02145 [Gammaproteobacteria bacterium RIFCSPLOWO2_02_FULL_56_15]
MILINSNPVYKLSTYQGILCAFLLFTQTTITAAELNTSALELLDRMSNATRELNYDGIFIYRRELSMDTMRLIHKSGNEGVTERLISLTGSPREVIRTRHSVTCIFPDNKQILVEKSRSHKFLSTQFPESIDRIAEYYDFANIGEDRVAGKETWVVVISPRDEYRYGYRLWIDKDSHLLLKSELNGNGGFPLEQILFTQMEILESIPDELLKTSINGAGYTLHNSSTVEHYREIQGVYWKAEWMPTGFALTNYEQKVNGEDAEAIEHLVYTDGLAMVSVFVEKTDNSPEGSPGVQKMGAVNVYSELIDGYLVTAVGEVPGATVRGMATSIVTSHQ